jgi:hypothetical protein
MKRVPFLLSLLCLLASLAVAPTVLAQARREDMNTAMLEVMRKKLNGERQTVVAAAMDLTRAEAESFWPLYDKYHAELDGVTASNLRVVRDFAEQYDKLPDAEATRLVNAWLENQEKAAKLRRKYARDFARILSPTKLLRYVQVENKIDVAIAQEFANEVPLIQQLNTPHTTAAP